MARFNPSSQNRQKRHRVGDLTGSQLMYTYSVGAVVDLPQISVIVTGLDDWPTNSGTMSEIVEPRLLQAVRAELGYQVQRMMRLPTADTSGSFNPLDPKELEGVPVATFPRWLFCPACRKLASLSTGLFSLQEDRSHPDRTHYAHEGCPSAKGRKPPAALPARFMVACENGHLDDFPWLAFVHNGTACTSPDLMLVEHGPSGEARDLKVVCNHCKVERRMSDAFGREGRVNLPACTARRPQLRDYDSERCDVDHMRAIILGASNLWFPVVYTTMSIPETEDELMLLVADRWATLQNVSSLEVLEAFIKTGMLGALSSYAPSDLYKSIETYKAQLQDSTTEDSEEGERASLKAPEWRVFTQPTRAPRSDDFQLRAVSPPTAYAKVFSQVVLVEKLREVRALAGFTRLDAPGEIADLDFECVGEKLAPIARNRPVWVPAAEIRGEGIFIQFQEDRIQQWLSKREVQDWDNAFRIGHRNWRAARYVVDPDAHYPRLRYSLLHTFAHALMRQFALECGYVQASMRERIYSRDVDEPDGPMAGVLIYTAAPDSEGTLGGLVRLGETQELGRHVTAALEMAELCTSDPTCAEHRPEQSTMALHGAACHACLFAPETSCERGNKYLDRALLVPTLTQADIAFFE